MKKFTLSAMLAISLLLGHKASAQKLIAQEDCHDSVIMQEADSVEAAYTKAGYLLLKASSVSMQSQYELPIVLPLNKGDWYQFIFIGDPGSVLYETRIYDWNEKQLQYQKKNHGDSSYNIIDCSFVPDVSQYYMIKPLQVNKKKKKMCGYVLLFKKTS
ncbi:MAG TPA: hypothetical protein VK559_05480 [Ferruginibacter sp.]|nr:hypothetical protein [Ferruginibacter sp.]